MAIPEYKNGHFEEMAAWSQILQIVGNSTYRLTPMTALGPSLYRNGKFLALMSLRGECSNDKNFYITNAKNISHVQVDIFPHFSICHNK